MKNLIKSEFFLHLKGKSLKLMFSIILLVCLSSILMMNIQWGDAVNIHVKSLHGMWIETELQMYAVNAEIDMYNFMLSDPETELDEATEKEYQKKLDDAYIYRKHNSELTRLAAAMTTSYLGDFLGSFMEEKYDFNLLLLDSLEHDYPLYQTYLGDYNETSISKELEMMDTIFENHYNYEYNRFDKNSINFLYFMVKDYPLYFIIFIIVFYVLKTFADTENPDAYKSVYVSSYSRSQINIAKILVSTVCILMATVLAISLTALLFGILYGFGTPQYPVIVSAGSDFIITNKITLILRQIPLTMLTIISIIFITYFLSMVLNSNTDALNLVAIYIIIHGLQLISTSILQFSPLYYLTMYEDLLFTKYTVLLVLLLLLLCSIAFLLLTLLAGKRKDLVGVKR